MKSYWIAAMVVLPAIWPSGSNSYIASLNQSKAEDQPVQQTQSSSASAVPQSSVTTQPPSGAPKTDAKEPAVKSAAAQPASYVLVELSKTLKANKLKPGDKVNARVSQDVISHGRIIIPVDTVLVGHVTEARMRDSEHPESRLGIVFDKILLKHYHDINFQAVVQAVAPPVIRRSLVDEPSQMLPPSMSGAARTTPSPAGGGTVSTASTSSRGQISTSTSSVTQSPANGEPTYQTPMTVKASPTTNAATGASAANLNQGSSGTSLSVGMQQGVTGLKGLSLSSAPSADTPGPVIVSNTTNVKLEYGTQILLRVLNVESQSSQVR